MTKVVETSASSNGGKAPPPRTATVPRIRRLAGAVALMEERRDRLQALDRRAEALALTDLIVVDGELAVISELEAILTAARLAVGSVEARPSDKAALDRLEHLVGPTSWDVLDELDALLTTGEALLEQSKSEVRRSLQPWTDIDASVRAMDQELRDRRAVVPRDLAAGRDRLASLVRRATIGLAEQRILDAWLALGELARPPTPTRSEEAPQVPADQIANGLASELDNVRQRSGRMQLTVLRGPLDRGRFEYTLMLLAPDGDRRVAVNVQDTTTIVLQDRKYFLGVLDQVGGNSYRALRDARPPDATRPPATSSALADLQEMGAVLFKLLVPDRMKQELRSNPLVPLSITTNDLELPWELMYDDADPSGTGAFLALQRPVSRMPVGRSRGRQAIATESPSARRKVALIASVGNPPLDGARAEVEKIEAGLKAQWGDKVEVEVLASGIKDKEPTGARFRELLLRGGYDIVHYAGHAAFDSARPDQSGLLLDGPEVCFAQKIQRLLRGNPLVFLNACETARLESPDSRPPPEGVYEGDPREGLASAFVYGGALACIGTMWPVSDDVAADFAVAFYGQVLEGQPLGFAMLQARTDTAAKHSDDASSAAFVLYGDPAFQLANPNPLLAPATS